MRAGELPVGMVVRALLTLAGLGVALLILAGAAGSLHPAGDSFAVFRASLAGIGLLVALWLFVAGAPRRALASALLPTLAMASLMPHWFGAEAAATERPGLTLYQKNLLYTERDASGTRDDILALRPDVVTLQEVHENNDRILDELRADYPAQIRCRARSTAGSVAILSRFPFGEGSARCSSTPGLASARVETPEGPVTLGAIHFEWPWPHRQPRQVSALLGEIAALDGPVVLAGDFNMVRWSSTVRDIAEASGTAPVGDARVTFPMAPGGFIGVSIDHILAPGGIGQTSLRPLLGSDHRGVLARIPLPAVVHEETPVADASAGADGAAAGL